MLKDARGRGDEAAKAILRSFSAEVGAERIIGWVREDNRAVLAMSRRVGFEVDGRLPLAEPVLMLGWSCEKSE
jgi:RimJ/RimL family protein N-acetyltransferase